MANFRTIDQLDPKGKRVLVRVDFNVPMQDGEVTDATRIERAAVTLKELMGKGAKVVALSHFGRPKGNVEPAMSLAPIARALGKALGGIEVAFGKDCIGPDAEATVGGVQEGGIALLENLRFHVGEEKNVPAFADALAAMGDVYVNDAFSCSHRAHASITGLAERLPTFAGRLMEAELKALTNAIGGASRPVAALVGGAKVSSKLDVLGHLLDKVDVLIIGGGMANTFLHAKGIDVGKSLCEKDLADTARSILEKAQAKRVRILLPVDGVVAMRFEQHAEHRVVPIGQVGAEEMVLDIGPDSAAAVEAALVDCRTLLWNGPLGAFEVEPFDKGTVAVAQAAAKLTDDGRLLSVAGGGDTVAALAHAGVLERFSYVSTAGGAFLEFIEGKDLPGVAALSR
ncbi:MAG TPA: phosphoglycerate kinase [Geminicoccus sp.]|jgi:phosphoglycerate kinase|uniref:phosphoglycerate kinase n=1 Tax=Geminicoccus sp. TaxID=2024832 RepID=UPI002E35CEC3|nr:phosphoglycerate kinase [Geminicoccus sp.]HEX2524728.1 phosphoglycerate kinase [Geminicoccus sp.]